MAVAEGHEACHRALDGDACYGVSQHRVSALPVCQGRESTPKNGSVWVQKATGLRLLSPRELGLYLDVTYVRRLVFDSRKLLREFPLWCLIAQEAVEIPSPQLETLVRDLVICDKVVVQHCDVGFGLFAREPLPANTFVGEYAGVVKPASGFDSYGMDYPATRSDGALQLSAESFGNVLRCVNHSNENPNVKFLRILVDDVCRVACVTSSSIDCGVQLLADYGQAYWTGAGLSPIQLK